MLANALVDGIDAHRASFKFQASIPDRLRQIPKPGGTDNSRSPFSREGNLMDQAEQPLPNVAPFPTPVAAPDHPYREFFDQAAHATCTNFTHLFVPAGMVEGSKGPWLTFSNDDTPSLGAAFQTSGRIWVHGSDAPCLKDLLRSKQLRSCVVSDVVRSDTGIVVKKHQSMIASLGALNSDLFCRSIKSLTVLERRGGWKNDKQLSVSSYLYAFECGPPVARANHEFPIDFKQIDVPGANEVILTPPASPVDTVEIIAEARSDLACIAHLSKVGTIRIHRVQKTSNRHRWTFSVNSDDKEAVLMQLKYHKVRCI